MITIVAIYTDGTIENFDDIEEANECITQLVTGCDFATTIESITYQKDDEEPIDLFCTWKCTIAPLPTLEELES